VLAAAAARWLALARPGVWRFAHAEATA
jgi:hypothetical protein